MPGILFTKGPMKTISEFEDKHIEQLTELYQGEWWSRGRTLEETRRAVTHSQISIGIVDDHGDLQGFARVITDFTFKALVFDVIVSDQCRDQGIGRRLLDTVQNHQKLKAVGHLELYCLPELESYYERHGFSAEVGGVRLLRQSRASQV